MDTNLWDSIFDSTTKAKPTVEKNKKTKENLSFLDLLDEAKNNQSFKLFCLYKQNYRYQLNLVS